MINDNLFFKLFANCKVVDGYSRSAICDLQNNKVKLIPTLLSEVLDHLKTKNVHEVKGEYNYQENIGIDLYLELLVKENLGFFCDNPNSFVELETKWDMPFRVTNFIIDLDSNSTYDLENIFIQLCELSCHSVQIRYYDVVKLEEIIGVLNISVQSSIRSIEIICPYDDSLNINGIEKIWSINKRIKKIILYNAPLNNHIELPFGLTLIQIAHNFNISKKCGVIHEKYFACNISHFMESQFYNNCLNRKISVDVNGEIKNCPSMLKTFGNINQINLQEVIAKEEFKELWLINKDKVSVCKHCEFRYICSDCRAYTEIPQDNYSKPLKCGYNPYTAEWEEWSTNPLKQKAIEYYGLEELVKKEK